MEIITLKPWNLSNLKRKPLILLDYFSVYKYILVSPMAFITTPERKSQRLFTYVSYLRADITSRTPLESYNCVTTNATTYL